MIHYILQVVAFQLFFLIIFDLFLRKETFFNWNRAYLLGTALLSVTLPFIKIEGIKTIVSNQFVVQLPEVIIGNTHQLPGLDPEIANYAGITTAPEPISIWAILLVLGMCIATALLLFKVFKLIGLYKQHPKYWSGNLLIINLLNSTAAFSFFNYIFMGERIQQKDHNAILEHELVHVNQKHTWDLVFFEVLRIVFWFNPLVYMYQNRMATLHEYIADSKAVKQQTKSQYYDQLLAQVFETQQFSFVNPFFKQSLIKKRILMLSQSKSKQINVLKYALLIPIVFGMLFYVSCSKQSLIDDDPAAYDLSKYSYSLEKSGEMSSEIQKVHEAYEDFLIHHPEYVSWAKIDTENNIISYSVHSIEEETPEGYNKLTYNFDNGNSYVSYMNIPSGSSSKAMMRIEEIAINDSDDEIEVPFSLVDQPPTTKACFEANSSREDRRSCLSGFIASHVNKNFNTNLATQLGLKGRMRINVLFKINKEGNIQGVVARAPHPELEKEAIRVVSSLPQFIPGTQKGHPVIVPYSLPILFQVQEDTQLKAIDKETSNAPAQEPQTLKSNDQDLIEVPFSVVEKAPRFEGCEDNSNNTVVQQCTSEAISKFVNANFNLNIAKENGIKGQQRINVIFKIGKDGAVFAVRSRASSPILEREIERVIKMLPTFTPGKQKGKLVVVPYSLPVLITGV